MARGGLRPRRRRDPGATRLRRLAGRPQPARARRRVLRLSTAGARRPVDRAPHGSASDGGHLGAHDPRLHRHLRCDAPAPRHLARLTPSRGADRRALRGRTRARRHRPAPPRLRRHRRASTSPPRTPRSTSASPSRRSPSPSRWPSPHGPTSHARSSGCATSAFTLGAVCLVIDGQGLLHERPRLRAHRLGCPPPRCGSSPGPRRGCPAHDMVASMVAELGIEVRTRLADGRAELGGGALRRRRRPTARRLRISVYGRDARDAEVASTVGRTIAYRDEGTALFVTRLQQAEHEAYVTLRARAALDGAATEVLAAGRAGPTRDGVVVTRRPRGSPLASFLDDGAEVPRGVGGRLLAAVAALGDRVALARLDRPGPRGRRVGRQGRSSTTSCAARPPRPRSARRATSPRRSRAPRCLDGADAALDAARHVVGDDRLNAALPYLQRAALPPTLAATVKRRSPSCWRRCATTVRTRLGVEAPELAKLTRVSVMTLVLAFGTLIGGWALIGVLLNVANSFDTIRGANLCGWLSSRSSSSLAYPMSALSCEGSIPNTLPYPQAREARAVEHVLGARRRHRGGPRGSRALLPEAGPRRHDRGELGRARVDGELDRQGRACSSSRCPSRGARSTSRRPRPTPRGRARRIFWCSSSSALSASRSASPCSSPHPRRRSRRSSPRRPWRCKAHLAVLAQHPVQARRGLRRVRRGPAAHRASRSVGRCTPSASTFPSPSC